MTEIELREPKWNFREYAKYTWHHWMLPLLGALVLTMQAFFPMRPSWFLVFWAFSYLAHTWLLTRCLMWHRKFQDSIADAYEELAKQGFEAGVKVGAEAERTKDKPWL